MCIFPNGRPKTGRFLVWEGPNPGFQTKNPPVVDDDTLQGLALRLGGPAWGTLGRRLDGDPRVEGSEIRNQLTS